MTISEATAQAPANFRQIPKWLTAIIIALVLAGGTWFVMSQFSGPREGVVFQIGSIPDPWGGRGPRQPPPPRQNLNIPGIHSIGGNGYRIQSGDFFMVLSQPPISALPVRLNYSKDMVSRDETALVRLSAESANPVIAKTLQLSDDQVKQLADVRKQSKGFIMSDADRDRLGKLWKSWGDAKDKGAKDAVQKDLLAAISDVGNRNLDATRKGYQDLAAQIKKIITDQQLVKYRQLRGF
jgi:hypothetical protein